MGNVVPGGIVATNCYKHGCCFNDAVGPTVAIYVGATNGTHDAYHVMEHYTTMPWATEVRALDL